MLLNIHCKMIKFFYLLLSVAIVKCLYISDSSEEISKDKIVGGNSIDITNAPYIAQILADGIHMCGGSIISDQWILTAAHCFKGTRHNYLTVITGSSWTGDEGQEHLIKKVILNKQYNPKTEDGDIALIKLAEPIEFDETQVPIAITNTPPKAGNMMKISGFGKIGQDLDFSDDLQTAFVPVTDRNECQRKYKSRNITITSNMFCAGLGSTDSCQGDSGGPAVSYGKLSGVVSFGYRCASSDYPGVYTQVYKYRKWIAEKTQLRI